MLYRGLPIGVCGDAGGLKLTFLLAGRVVLHPGCHVQAGYLLCNGFLDPFGCRVQTERSGSEPK